MACYVLHCTAFYGWYLSALSLTSDIGLLYTPTATECNAYNLSLIVPFQECLDLLRIYKTIRKSVFGMRDLRECVCERVFSPKFTGHFSPVEFLFTQVILTVIN